MFHLFRSFRNKEPQTIKIKDTTIPGLFDIALPDGRRMYDMTVGQIETLAVQNGWPIERTQD